MTPKAFVVLHENNEQEEEMTQVLQNHVKPQLLPYKYPRAFGYLSELTKTASNKIDRQALLKLDT
jgi:acyl-coenzyme A synthetase/AMP-(fatty) acid ligase